jgi:uncharacterized protein (DUF4415 family)
MNPKKVRPDAIAQGDWDAVDSPDLSEDLLKGLRPLAETHPDIQEAHKAGGLRRRGPQKAPTKILVSIRYSMEVLDYFRATGPHLQSKMDEVLKQWIQEHPGTAGCSPK